MKGLSVFVIGPLGTTQVPKQEMPGCSLYFDDEHHRQSIAHSASRVFILGSKIAWSIYHISNSAQAQSNEAFSFCLSVSKSSKLNSVKIPEMPIDWRIYNLDDLMTSHSRSDTSSHAIQTNSFGKIIILTSRQLTSV